MVNTFFTNYQQGVKYSAQIESHEAEMRRKGKVIEKKSLSISDLQIDYLNLENLVRNNEREIVAQSRFSHCGGLHPT